MTFDTTSSIYDVSHYFRFAGGGWGSHGFVRGWRRKAIGWQDSPFHLQARVIICDATREAMLCNNNRLSRLSWNTDLLFPDIRARHSLTYCYQCRWIEIFLAGVKLRDCCVLIILYLLCHRDCIGDSCVVGDSRWGGAFGVTVDLVSLSHCSVQIIQLEDVQVRECAVVIARSHSLLTIVFFPLPISHVSLHPFNPKP